MRVKDSIRRLETLAAKRQAVVVEIDHRAANAAFNAALRALPDGEKLCRALARRVMGIPFVPFRWDRSEIHSLSEQELRDRLAVPLAAMRAFRRGGSEVHP